MPLTTKIRVNQLSGSFGNALGLINDGGANPHLENKAALASIGGTIEDLSGSLSYIATAIRRIHGGADFSNQAEGTFSVSALLPAAAGGVDLGSTSFEWGDVFLGDAKKIAFGIGQESRIIDGAPGLDIDSAEQIDIGSTLGNTAPINIGAIAQAKTITVGNDASTKVDVNALAIELDSAGTIVADSVGAMTLTAGATSIWSTSAGDLTIDAAGVLTLDSDGTDAVNLGTEAAAKTITIGNAASAEVQIDAIRVDINAVASGFQIDGAGNSNLSTSGTGTLTIDSAGALVIDTDGTDNISIGVEAAAKTITIGDDASTKVDVNALAIELDSAGTLVGTSVGATTLTAGAASTWSTSAGALTLTSAGAATWGTAAGVLTIDGTGGLNMDSSGTAAVDLATGAAAKTITIGNDASTTVDVNALDIQLDAGSGGYDIDGAGNSTLTTSGTGTLTIDSAGALVIDTDGTDAISIGVEAAAKTITVGNDASTKVDVNALAIELDSAGTLVANSVGATTITAGATSVWSTSVGDLTIDAAGILTLDSDGTDAVNLGTEAAAKTITVGNDASAKVDVNALIIELDSAGTIVGNSVGATTLTAGAASTWSTSAGALTLTSAAAATWSTAAGILTLDGTGGLNMDSSGTAAVNLATASAAKTITIGADASTKVDVNALAIELDSGASGIVANSLGVMTLDAADNSSMTVTGAAKDLTLSVAGGGAQQLFVKSAGTSAAAIVVATTAGGIDVDAVGGKLQLDGSTGIDIGGLADVAVDVDASTFALDASGALTLTSTDNTGKTTINHNHGDALAGIKLTTIGAGPKALEFVASAGGVNALGTTLALSASNGGLYMSSSLGITFAGSGMLSGEGPGVLGCGLAVDADWNDFISNFSNTHTIIGAINSLKTSDTAEPTLFMSSSWAKVLPQNAVTVTKVAGNSGISNLLAHKPSNVLVYVNGQLLAMSGSGGGNVPLGYDYVVQGTGSTNQLKFSFDLEQGDQISVYEMS